MSKKQRKAKAQKAKAQRAGQAKARNISRIITISILGVLGYFMYVEKVMN